MENAWKYWITAVTLCVACSSSSTNRIGSFEAGTAAEAGAGGQSGNESGGQTGTDGSVDGQAGAPSGGASGGAGTDAGTGGASGNDSGTGGSDACVPQPCANDGVTCGQLPDGCGGMAKCPHQCAAPDTCGSKTPNKCACVEHTQLELDQLCVGKCAVPSKCTQGSVTSCSGRPGACTLDGPYDVCDGSKTFSTSPPPTGECLKCARTGAVSGGCSYGSGRPFEYVCGAGAECSKGSDCGSGLCPDGLCYCVSHSQCPTGVCDANSGRCAGYDSDNLQDNEETDVDCGGPKNPVKCAPGKKCLLDSDCDTFSTGVCQGAAPPGVFGTCLSSGGPKSGCLKTGGNKVCCQDSVSGWRPYTAGAAVTDCAGKGLPFVFIKAGGPSATPPKPGCVSGAGWWCCPDSSFL